MPKRSRRKCIGQGKKRPRDPRPNTTAQSSSSSSASASVSASFYSSSSPSPGAIVASAAAGRGKEPEAPDSESHPAMPVIPLKVWATTATPGRAPGPIDVIEPQAQARRLDFNPTAHIQKLEKRIDFLSVENEDLVKANMKLRDQIERMEKQHARENKKLRQKMLEAKKVNRKLGKARSREILRKKKNTKRASWEAIPALAVLALLDSTRLSFKKYTVIKRFFKRYHVKLPKLKELRKLKKQLNMLILERWGISVEMKRAESEVQKDVECIDGSPTETEEEVDPVVTLQGFVRVMNVQQQVIDCVHKLLRRANKIRESHTAEERQELGISEELEESIRIVFGGDGKVTGHKFTSTKVNLKVFYGQLAEEVDLGIMNSPEEYSDLKALCDFIQEPLQSLETAGLLVKEEDANVTIDGRSTHLNTQDLLIGKGTHNFSVSLAFRGDMKFLRLFNGLGACSRDDFCIWCSCEKEDLCITSKEMREKNGPLKERDRFYYWEEVGRGKKKERKRRFGARDDKKTRGQKRNLAPIFGELFPAWKIIPDILHFLLRCVNRLLKYLIDDVFAFALSRPIDACGIEKRPLSAAERARRQAEAQDAIESVLKRSGVASFGFYTKENLQFESNERTKLQWNTVTGKDCVALLKNLPDALPDLEAYLIGNALENTQEIWRQFANIYFNIVNCEDALEKHSAEELQETIDEFFNRLINSDIDQDDLRDVGKLPILEPFRPQYATL